MMGRWKWGGCEVEMVEVVERDHVVGRGGGEGKRSHCRVWENRSFGFWKVETCVPHLIVHTLKYMHCWGSVVRL